MAIHLNSTQSPTATRSTGRAMLRGMLHRCPSCGESDLFARYLKVRDHCAHCHEALHHHRADDAPPYFTIFIVGHIAVGGVLAMEQAMKPSVWLHAAIWMPFVIISCLLLLPRIKGILVGLQWALRMHGFGGESKEVATPETPVQPPVSR
ncbi:MAG: DUF983 domain-containing protein [Hyphomicrobiaceae bacterium]